MHWFNTREDYPLLFNICIGKNFFFEKEFEIIIIVILLLLLLLLLLIIIIIVKMYFVSIRYDECRK